MPAALLTGAGARGAGWPCGAFPVSE